MKKSFVTLNLQLTNQDSLVKAAPIDISLVRLDLMERLMELVRRSIKSSMKVSLLTMSIMGTVDSFMEMVTTTSDTGKMGKEVVMASL